MNPQKNTAWWLYKARAALISFSISAILITLLTLVMTYYFYQEWFLFRYDGGWQGLKIVLAVDLVLGPVIAFIIFNTNKAWHLILFDVIVVGTIQISAFLWGCYALWSQHPLALIYRDGTFNTIVLADLKNQEKNADVLIPFNTRKPVLIFSKPPTDEKNGVVEALEMFTKGIAPYMRVENFAPINNHLNEIFADDAICKEALEKEAPGVLAAFTQKNQLNINTIKLVPASLRNTNGVLVMDEDANIKGLIPVSYNFDSVIDAIKSKRNNKR